MRKLFGIVAIVALMGLVSLQGRADEKKADTAKLDGSWELTGFEIAGMKIDVPKGKEMTLTFKAGKVTKKEAGKKDEDGTYKVDDTKKIHEIDLTVPMAGDATKTETIKGIYMVDGDTLKIGFGGKPDAGRPTGFDAKEVGIMSFKRVKK